MTAVTSGARQQGVPGRGCQRRLEKAPGFYLILTDQPGKESWPITGATFILMHKKQDKPERAAEVLKFFDWSYKNGGQNGRIARLHPDAGKRHRDLRAELAGRSKARTASRYGMATARDGWLNVAGGGHAASLTCASRQE